jgi:hypothetical protein
MGVLECWVFNASLHYSITPVPDMSDRLSTTRPEEFFDSR